MANIKGSVVKPGRIVNGWFFALSYHIRNVPYFTTLEVSSFG